MTQSNKIGVIGSGKLYNLWKDEIKEDHDLYDDTKSDLPNILECKNDIVYIAIGHNPSREKFFSMFADRKITEVISKNCFISYDALIGYGCFISNFCTINSGARVGNGLVMAANSTIDVNAIVGDFVRISPQVYIGDNAKIGKGCIISAGVTILPGVELGENVYVAAGSVVSHSFGNNETVAGVPARRVNGNNELHRI